MIQFSAEIYKKMEVNPYYGDCRGIQESLRYIQAVLTMYLDSARKSDYIPPGKDAGLRRNFDSLHPEWNEMCACFVMASHMNGVILFHYPDAVEARVQFFKKDQEHPFAETFVVFGEVNGNVRRGGMTWSK